MAKTRVKVTHQGVTETPVEDGQTFMPEGVGVSPDDIDETAGVEEATPDFLDSILTDNGAEVIEPIEIECGGKVLRFLGVKHLSPRETSALLRKRMRLGANGRLVPATDSELTLKINALASCIFRNIGTPEKPDWVPMWTYDQVAGKGELKGIVDNAKPEVKELIANLLNAAWVANPETNPFFLAQLEAATSGEIKVSLSE